MRAMVLRDEASGRLEPADLPRPAPGPGEVLVRVSACGVCRTDLHVVDGDLPDPRLPLVPGHEIVGTVIEAGAGVVAPAIGTRVGVPWLGGACGACRTCTGGRENLCPDAVYTGYRVDGGFAEFAVADHRYVFPIPGDLDDLHAAPLLCAGLIGYRAYRMALDSVAGPVAALALYGFGAAAHILTQVAVHDRIRVHAFTRPGDRDGQEFARELGAVSATGSDEPPPEPLDAAILFAPVGALVPVALCAVRPAGAVVCAGIHMSDIPSFPYRLLWEERVLRSVANLTRRDAVEFLDLAHRIPVRTHVAPYPLEDAGRALDDLRNGRIRGAAVVVP